MPTPHEVVTEALKDHPRPLNDLESLIQVVLLDAIAAITGDQAARGAIAVVALLAQRPADESSEVTPRSEGTT